MKQKLKKEDSAVETFKKGYNCAQSVLSSFGEYTGLSKDFSLKIATGFGAGIARTEHVCGALSGGIMALNILLGRGENEGREKQDELYSIIREFIDRFKKLNRTIICRELIDGCDLLTPEGQERYHSEELWVTCHSCISASVRLVEEIFKKNL